MGTMFKIFPAPMFAGFGEELNGVRLDDNTPMVFLFDLLLDHIEHDALCLLMCGDTITANMPDYVGMTKEEYDSVAGEVAAMFNAENPPEDW